jgi:hypothetical protein
MVTPSNILNELLYIISFDLYTLSKTLFHAKADNLSVSHFCYIWTIFTAEHVLTGMVTSSSAFKRITLYYQFWPVYRL